MMTHSRKEGKVKGKKGRKGGDFSVDTTICGKSVDLHNYIVAIILYNIQNHTQIK